MEEVESNGSSLNNSLAGVENPGYGFYLPAHPIPLAHLPVAGGIRGIMEQSEPESLGSSPNRSGLTDSAVSFANTPESGQDSPNLTDLGNADHQPPTPGSGEDSADLTGSGIEAPPQESGQGPAVMDVPEVAVAVPVPSPAAASPNNNWRRVFPARAARELAIVRNRYILETGRRK